MVDVETQIGYALSAQQTFAQTDLPDLTRMEQYLYHLDTVRCELPPSVKYLAVDGAYAKENFVTGAVHLQLHVISKLRTRRESAPFSIRVNKNRVAENVSTQARSI